ncbi:MAG: LamG-like jellyroll fold domain-containing protein, partial [bacterium]
NDSVYSASATYGSGTQIGTSGWYCIPLGNWITGLQPNTTYTIQVCEFNAGYDGLNIVYNTTSATDNPEEFTTLSIPSTQATGITITDICTNAGYFRSFTAGDGQGRIAFIKQGSGVGTANPVTDSVYTASATYGSGTQIGTSGWYSIPAGGWIAGLQPNTTYTIQICEFNAGHDGLNIVYNTTSVIDNPKEFTTRGAPTEQATNIITNWKTTKTANITWTRGNGDFVAVFVKAANSGMPIPKNFTTYVPNLVFGTGAQIDSSGWYCILNSVYGASPVEVNIYGLDPNTDYRVFVCEFNSSQGIGDEAYLLTSSTENPNSFKTLVEFNNPVAYFPFSGNAMDASGNGNNGAVNGAVLTTDRLGNENSAYSFNGDFISAPTNNFPIDNSPRTIQCWIKPASSGNDTYPYAFVNYGTGGGTRQNFGLGFVSSQLYVWSVNNDLYPGLTIPSEEWSSIAVTYSPPTTITMWINGCKNDYQFASDLITTESQFFIGAGTADDGSSFWNFFNGIIDEVKVFNRVLTDDEIISMGHYAPGTQANNIVVNNVSTATSNISWTRGTGQKVVVFIKEGNNGTVNLTDSTTYVADATFGEGTQLGTTGWFCIFNGNGSNINIEGLTTGKTYQVLVCEYNGSTGTELYNINSAINNPSVINTLDIPTTQCSAVTINHITPRSVLLSWTRGNGNGIAVFIIKSDAGTAHPVDFTNYTSNANFGNGTQIDSSGWYCVYYGTGSSVKITGLLPNTQYRIHSCEFNGTNGTEAYNTSSTLNNPFAFSTPIEFLNPLAYYPFNGNANDVSGNGNNGTVYGASLMADRFGNANSAYSFNNSGNYIELFNDLKNIGIDTSFTLSAWINSSSSNNQMIFSDSRDGNGLQFYFGLIPGSNAYYLALTTNQSSYSNSIYVSPLLNEWSMITCTYDNDSLNLFINKDHILSTPLTGNILAGVTNLIIGYFPGWQFNGAIDDILIYNRALLKNEIDSLRDLSGFGKLLITSPIGGEEWKKGTTHDITWTNDITISNVNVEFSTNNGITWNAIVSNTPASTGSYSWLIPDVNSYECKIRVSNSSDSLTYIINSVPFTIFTVSPPNRCLSFDGVDDYVYIPISNWDVIGNGNFTIECWINPWNFDGDYRVILGNQTTDQFQFNLDNGGMSNARLELYAGGSNLFTGNLFWQSNQWYHLAVIKSDNTVKFFRDGQLLGSGEHTASIGVISALYVGFRALTGHHPFSGKIDELRFWNIARSQNEIRENMFTPLEGNESGLLGYFKFNHGSPSNNNSSVTVLSDYSPKGNNGTLTNFGLADSTSNWVLSTLPIGIGDSFSQLAISDTGSVILNGIHLILQFPDDGFDEPCDLTVTEILNAPNTFEGIAEFHSDRYWIVNYYGNPGIFSARMTFTVPSSFISAYGNNMLLYSREGNSSGVWHVVGILESFTDSTVTFSGINSFSQFTLGASDAPVPVELSSFAAVNYDGKIKLEWRTETELNNAMFEVERKIKTEKEWQTLGSVEGHGYSNSPKEYSFIDKNPIDGKLEYRLKQIDTDGLYQYSKIVEIDFLLPKQFALWQNYPNPFNPSTTITFELPFKNNVTLTIYDIIGRKVKTLVNEEKMAGKYSIVFNAENLSSGVYFYELKAGNYRNVKKLSLLK